MKVMPLKKQMSNSERGTWFILHRVNTRCLHRVNKRYFALGDSWYKLKLVILTCQMEYQLLNFYFNIFFGSYVLYEL